MVTANPTVVSPNSVPVQILTASGQVVSQAMQVQQSPQQQQHTTIVQQHHQVQQQQQVQQNHVQQQQTIVQVQSNNQIQQQQVQQVVQQVQHQQQIHNMPKPKSHFCQHCSKGFATKNGLLQHTRRHPEGQCTVRAHVCECGKAFFQKNHLMLHQRQHIENKPQVGGGVDLESG